MERKEDEMADRKMDEDGDEDEGNCYQAYDVMHAIAGWGLG